jgi:hypothetical protein
LERRLASFHSVENIKAVANFIETNIENKYIKICEEEYAKNVNEFEEKHANDIKKFEETVDAPSLLYFFSDVTYFRGKVFEDIIKSAYYYKDNMGCGLGSISAIRTVKNIVYDSYGKRDKLFNKAGAVNKDSQFIYFIIGDIHNEAEMTEEIKNMAFHIVDENLQARMKMGIIDEDLQEKIKNLGKAKSKSKI